MAFKTTVEEVEALPPGTCEAHFKDIEPNTTTDGRDFWRWTFDVTADDGEVVVSALSSAKLTRQTKSGEWVAEITGNEVEPGVHDWFAMQGLPCQLVLTTKETDRGEFNDIEKILPAKEGQVRKEQNPEMGDTSPY